MCDTLDTHTHTSGCGQDAARTHTPGPVQTPVPPRPRRVPCVALRCELSRTIVIPYRVRLIYTVYEPKALKTAQRITEGHTKSQKVRAHYGFIRTPVKPY